MVIRGGLERKNGDVELFMVCILCNRYVDLYLGGESNPYLKIRNFPFYPLNYQGISSFLKQCKVTHNSRILQIPKASLLFTSNKRQLIFIFRLTETLYIINRNDGDANLIFFNPHGKFSLAKIR